jgi:hypothetical protein
MNKKITIGELYLKFHSMKEELMEILNALDSIESDMGTKNTPYKVLKKLFDEKSREVTEFENMEIELYD